VITTPSRLEDAVLRRMQDVALNLIKMRNKKIKMHLQSTSIITTPNTGPFAEPTFVTRKEISGNQMVGYSNDFWFSSCWVLGWLVQPKMSHSKTGLFQFSEVNCKLKWIPPNLLHAVNFSEQ
jgi:hypothetical protein